MITNYSPFEIIRPQLPRMIDFLQQNIYAWWANLSRRKSLAPASLYVDPDNYEIRTRGPNAHLVGTYDRNVPLAQVVEDVGCHIGRTMPRNEI